MIVSLRPEQCAKHNKLEDKFHGDLYQKSKKEFHG